MRNNNIHNRNHNHDHRQQQQQKGQQPQPETKLPPQEFIARNSTQQTQPLPHYNDSLAWRLQLYCWSGFDPVMQGALAAYAQVRFTNAKPTAPKKNRRKLLRKIELPLHSCLGGGFNYFFCSPLLGVSWSNLTNIFPNGLVQPPTSCIY